VVADHLVQYVLNRDPRLIRHGWGGHGVPGAYDVPGAVPLEGWDIGRSGDPRTQFLHTGTGRDGAESCKGHIRRKGARALNTDTLPDRGTSAGRGDTTVGDLLRFATALMGRVLLDARHAALLTTGKVDTGGGAPGMNGDLRVLPDSGYVVAAPANVDFGAADVVSWVSERLPIQER
jgi:hypothetical protein